jgi:hypothetical protein
MHPLALVNLTKLMDMGEGSPAVSVGLIDGPLDVDHVGLNTTSIKQISSNEKLSCRRADSHACAHATFIAGILSANRSYHAPAICPSCTLLVHPIFSEAHSDVATMPYASSAELAAAIVACVNAGARVINLSLALAQASDAPLLDQTMDYAMKRGTIIVAAAGNYKTIGSSAITRHPWVIPVAACSASGAPTSISNLSGSIATRGLRAPGDNVESLSPTGMSMFLSGTSVSVPFVTGAVALIWSEFPDATAGQVKLAITQALHHRPTSITPILLDAWAAFTLLKSYRGSKEWPRKTVRQTK